MKFLFIPGHNNHGLTGVYYPDTLFYTGLNFIGSCVANQS